MGVYIVGSIIGLIIIYILIIYNSKMKQYSKRSFYDNGYIFEKKKRLNPEHRRNSQRLYQTWKSTLKEITRLKQFTYDT